VGGLVQRGQRAAAGCPARGVGRFCRRAREGVERDNASAHVLGPRHGHPFVVQPDARRRVERGEVAACDRRPDLVDVRDHPRERDGRPGRLDGVGAERPPQPPDGGAEVGPRGREVGPEARGQRIPFVRTGVQGEVRQQSPVGTRQGHRFAVALGGDVAEQPDP
jgi:hypothetical protein